MVAILRKSEFSIQAVESIIHNQAIFMVYDRFIHEDNIRDKILLSKS